MKNKKYKLKKGIFITFEGPERSGKSTHSRLLANFLKSEGYDILYTREPGGTELGDNIRKLLLHSREIEISPLAEALLFEASRAELVRNVIKPALLKKKIVISDRFSDATLVYQGYAGKVPIKDIKALDKIAVNGVNPLLTVLLDIDLKRGVKKICPGERDRMESKKISFHKKVREGYLRLAEHNKKRIKIIRTKSTIDDTFREVKKEVMDVVRRYKRTG
ncbi:MAG: dTMP kinase [Candidatus Omnitrophota bacterium]